MKTQIKKKSTGIKNLAVKKNYPITDFDPVKMMRDIRDKLTEEIADMTHEEEMEYLKKLIAKG
jgi:hypothetical protein